MVRVGGGCVCACFVVVLSAAPGGGSRGSGGRAGASGLARPSPAAPQPGRAGGQLPEPCCLVDRSSRGSLVLSRQPPRRAGCGLCPRAASPFRIRTNRVLCQGAQRAPARGSPVFCWAGEGVFRSPVVSINDLVFLWWCSVFWPSPSPHSSSVCKSVVCHENDRAAQRVPVSFPFHLPAGPRQLPGGLLLPPPPQPSARLQPPPAPPAWRRVHGHPSPSGSCLWWVCFAEPRLNGTPSPCVQHPAALPAAARGSLHPRAGVPRQDQPFWGCGGSHRAARSGWGYRPWAGHGEGDGRHPSSPQAAGTPALGRCGRRRRTRRCPPRDPN